MCVSKNIRELVGVTRHYDIVAFLLIFFKLEESNAIFVYEMLSCIRVTCNYIETRGVDEVILK